MFEDLTVETVKKEILDYVAEHYPKLSAREGSFLDVTWGALAVQYWEMLRTLDAFIPAFYIDETSGGYIDLQSGSIGMTRKAGTRARAEITLTGRAGTALAAGTVFLTAGGLEFELTEAVAIGEDGAAVGELEAAEVGSAYNVEAGAICRMYVNPLGLDGFAAGAARGGTDAETDAELVARYYERRRKPPTSGNVYHYDQWAREVDGVGLCKVLPLWAGPGSVRVLVSDKDLGEAAGAILEAVEAHIREEMPIGPAVTVAGMEAVEIAVSVSGLLLDASATLAQVQSALTAALGAYFRAQAESSVAQHYRWYAAHCGAGVTQIDYAGDTYTLRHNAVAMELLSIPGVLDFGALTMNGSEGNLQLAVGQLPRLGRVEVAL
ncbi:baseplate J/gp47 family protein [Lawsonibacter faecis]|uniref:Baseplate J/gp47 family protein n=1 Tax=Lawsonibacter faecis TaxID=2763052 RepID=A0A8J6MCA2_9FIRM|nr:baseplate J/gp47 family protein [Lawsonibacter faecis]MBC5736069.1 baseplate J/gp47 family protein [Lawsonibacter faecis]